MKKQACWFLLLLLFFGSLLYADNPIISHKYTADPNAMVYKDRVYVYCSRDDNNNNGYDIVDYTLISSDDLVNWTDHGEVFNAKNDTKWANLAYAPACIEKNGKFYLYFPDGGSSIGVAVGDRPEGPFKDPLGKSLVNKNMPNCNVEWCFDPAIFIDDDGQAYLYFGGGSTGTGKNLRVILLNDDMISVKGQAITIEAPNSFEASFMHKYNGKYYFSYATTGASKIDYMMSDNPTSGFVYKGTVLDNPTLNGQNINRYNNNHASIIKFKDKWYIFYHDRRLSNEVYFRNVCVDFLYYNSDGTIKKVVVTSESVPQLKYMNPFDTIQAETIDRQKGIKTDKCNDGGIMVKEITNGDWIRYTGIDFGNGASKFEVRAACVGEGGKIEIRIDNENGTLAGSCEIKSTGGWDKWNTFSCEVKDLKGVVKNINLVFKGNSSTELFRLNWFKFSGTTKTITANLVTNNKSMQQTIAKKLFLNGLQKDGGLFFDLSGRLINTNYYNIENKANNFLLLKRDGDFIK
ncbi:MAG: glycoside hydrolase family 43 protein [Chitinispirillaceae bacterium]|nr:glycoside hydrolase family 43 protein [Chitinispirillaceae bacterium]